MKKRVFLSCLLLALLTSMYGQQERKEFYLPSVGLKTNLLYWGTTTPNLGLEFGLSKKTTLDVSGNYNPWTFSDSKKFKHWLVQPEFRFWTCERFYGHFFGVHGHYAEYNVANIKLIGTDDYRYQGKLYGGGVSYGYHWIISKHFSIEATIGVGYAHLKYDKYECGKYGQELGRNNKNYVGPTKAGINLIYVIK
ncbi:MAG: DUF3575 domain-containing protein [Bacteroides sp.]|nr:DUF3575 domain-containing protein [Bacteroides sp.]